MNRFLLFACVLFTGYTFAQITLTGSDFATSNDTVRMSRTTDFGIDFSSTGANYTWDYSSLVPESQLLRDFSSISNAGTFAQFLFGFFAPTDYQANYFLPNSELPLAQITSFLPITIEDVFQYTKKSNTAVNTVGYSMNVTFSGTTTNVPFQSELIETRYDLPLTMGQSYSSTGYTNVDFNPIYDAKWVQLRERNTTVDGYGSITTPFGTFDALRLHHAIDEIDSIYLVLPIIGGNWLPLTIPTVNEYEWWTNGQKEPILRIRTSSIAGQEAVTLIEFRDQYRPEIAGLDDNTQNTLSVYPNPAVDYCLVQSDSPISTVEIIDSWGRSIQTQNGGKSLQTTIDLTSFEVGVYWLKVNTEKGIQTLRVVKH